jgi:hypothetical protein
MKLRAGETRTRPPLDAGTRTAILEIATLLAFLVGVLGLLVMVLGIAIWRALARTKPVPAEEPEELFTFVR